MNFMLSFFYDFLIATNITNEIVDRYVQWKEGTGTKIVQAYVDNWHGASLAVFRESICQLY